MISKKQFQILSTIERADISISQRELSKQTGLSLGTVNKVINELNEFGLVADGIITQEGIIALEPFRVRTAVILAAGFGARLAPITFNTPKPLVRIHGTRIIDSIVDACLAAEINNIYIVRGYLSEQFDQLLEKYPMLNFIDNEEFNESSSISSAYLVKDKLSNSYVIEGDILLKNPSIIRKYQYTSSFLGIKRDMTNDWCFEARRGVITKQKLGGEKCWQVVGISYWNEEDGYKLNSDIEEIYKSPGGKERFWEQVPLVYCKSNYSVELIECTDSDVAEIDTLKELKEIDETYNI